MMVLKYQVKKNLGQNFLVDVHVRERIIQECNLSKSDTVIEIGPGQGALTHLIASRVKRLIIVETDRDLIPYLNTQFESQVHVEIIHADFLKWNMGNALGLPHSEIKVIGNIPYNISTPIIEYLIEHRAFISKSWLTVQLEFANRLVAQHNSKDYGSLTCFLKYYAHSKILFKISKGSFHPRPQVDSALISLDFKKPLDYVSSNEKRLFSMIRTVFTQRRKTMLNALSLVVSKEKADSILKDLGISSQKRPETLELQEFIKIAEKI